MSVKKRRFEIKNKVVLESTFSNIIFSLIILMFGVVVVLDMVAAVKNRDNIGLSPNNEGLVTLEGRYQVSHYDYFDEGRSETFYYLNTLDGTKYKLNFVSGTEPSKIPGGNIRVTGIIGVVASGDNEFSVKTLETLTSSNEESSSIGNQKLAVILYNFESFPKQPITKEETENILLKDVKDYFKEISYNKLIYEGSLYDVYGWYTLPSSGSGDGITRILRMADPDIEYTSYNKIIMIYPSSNPFGTRGGATYITLLTDDSPEEITISIAQATKYTSQDYWTIEEISDIENTVKHELGHLILSGTLDNVKHANGYECRENPMSQSICTSLEYVDPYDVMGLGKPGKESTSHMNAVLKEKIGWLNPTNVLIYENPGVYTLKPFEIVTNSIQAIKIPINIGDKSTWYYLEYRQSIGFDKINIEQLGLTPGLLVHLKCLEEFNCNQLYGDSLLIDTTPQSILNPNQVYPDPDFKDSALTQNNYFVDPINNIKINILQATIDEVKINIVKCYTESDITAALSDYYMSNINIQELSEILNRYLGQNLNCNL